MLTISGVTYRVGGKRGRALLNDASVHIAEGCKLGLVGRNGIGKSTLLDLIRGRLLPDDGDILLPRGIRLGFLAQEAPSGDGTPLATVLAADRERAKLLAELDAGPAPARIAEIEARLETIGARSAPARAARILAGLGFDTATQETSLGKLEPVAIIEDTPPIELRLPEPAHLRPPLITLEKASVGYAEGQPVLSGLDLRLDPDDRIALLGANGNGKTTFARLLAGRLPAMSGAVTRPSKLVTGFFAQHQIEELQPSKSAYDHLAALLPNLNEEAIRARLGSFGFGQDKAFVPVASLSGGERARLNLALVTHDAPALLILDEPTNHLDMGTRESLVEALSDYAGAVVLVSHDWHLVELVADRLWLVAGGTVREFEGDLDDYRRLLAEREPAALRNAAGDGRRDERRLAAARRQAQAPLRQRAR